MRVCFVAHLSDLSGANRSLIDLVTTLRGKGINIFVVVPRKGELSRELDRLNISYKSIYSGAWVGFNRENKLKKYAKKIINYFAERRYYYFFNKNRFDIVHYNSFIYGVGASSLVRLNIPYVWHIREFPEETFGLVFYNKKNSYDLVSKSEKIFAISGAIYNRFSNDFGKDKMTTIYNGVNTKEFQNHIEETAPINKTCSLLLVGAIAEDKGQLEAVKAVGYLIKTKKVNVKLHIVGGVIDNNYLIEIENFISNANLEGNIIFHGYQTNTSKFRKDCDIALVCSKMEAFGRVTIEAMLSKQLVIGANTGGTVELVQDNETGLLYNQGDFYSLAKQIEFAICNEQSILKIIDCAYEYSKKHFTIERTADEVIDQYEKVRR